MIPSKVWRMRSIPVCAGEPSPGPFPAQDVTVYPRVCGGTQGAPNPGTTIGGLSPCVRGNPSSARIQE